MLTVDEFRRVLAKREKREKPYSKAHIFFLIQMKKIKPAPEKIGKGRGVYILDDNAVVK